MDPELDVAVDKALCVGNLWCVRNLPGVFHANAEGQAEVLESQGVSEEEIVDVAFGCPVGAISVVNAKTGQDLLI